MFQASILKKYPAELILVFFYCFFVAILSGVTCLVVEKDISAWSLESKLRLLSVLYSVIKTYFWIEVQLIDSINSYALSLFLSLKLHISRESLVLQFTLVLLLGVCTRQDLFLFIGVVFLGDAFYLGRWVVCLSFRLCLVLPLSLFI
jgi:hypothetical protein